MTTIRPKPSSRCLEVRPPPCLPNALGIAYAVIVLLRRAGLLPLLALDACVQYGIVVREPSNPAGVDSEEWLADTSAVGDTSDTGVDPNPGALWCERWESGDLGEAGYAGSYVEMDDGAKVLVATEGDRYSALRGEESLDYHGTHALVLRSNDAGDVDSVAITTSPGFTVEADSIWWWQLSEVDDPGISLVAEVLDPDTYAVLGRLDVPVETGGFIPGLEPDQDPIAGFPQITYGPGVPGELVRQVADLSLWDGQTIRLRFRQHTKVQDQGFFTVLDDICHGDASGERLHFRAAFGRPRFPGLPLKPKR